ncbi:MAG: hypothetical protein WAQ45_10390, partial [Trichococcus flocculiformis]
LLVKSNQKRINRQVHRKNGCTCLFYGKKRIDEKVNEKLKDFALLSLHFCDLIYNGYKKNRERKVG